jgi:glycosyltransferase involved in cell wall biosynthesis
LPDRPVRILHAHSTFSLGGKEARAVRLMNAFGDAAEHVILSATGQFGARDAIAPGIAADFPEDAPTLVGKPGPGRYRALAAYMKRFDLVLTYNWGAMDVVAARRLFGGPPLVHHEDGFNSDEAVRQKPARVWFRRLMLPAASKVVVPSQTLERIARTTWRQPYLRVERIANGIAVERYRQTPEPGSIAGFRRQPGEIVVGTAAGLREVKNLPRLVRAFAQAKPPSAPTRLLIVGEGPERDRIETESLAWGVEESILMPGFLADPSRWIGHFDLFALSSDSEQFPISLVEAMAAGLPCVATRVGDVAEMLPPGNVVVDARDEAGLAAGLNAFLADPEKRRSVGAANRAKALAEYDEGVMISRYAALYGEAIGRADAFRHGATAILRAG